jgi:hypothetical protein
MYNRPLHHIISGPHVVRPRQLNAKDQLNANLFSIQNQGLDGRASPPTPYKK